MVTGFQHVMGDIVLLSQAGDFSHHMVLLCQQPVI